MSKANENTIVQLKQQRGRIKASLTKLETFAEDITTSTKNEEITIRLQKLEELLSSFSRIDNSLVVHDVPSEFDQFEDRYFKIKGNLISELNSRNIARTTSTPEPNNPLSNQLNVTLVELFNQQKTFFETFAQNSQQSQSNASPGDVRLPKINLPTFNGDFKDWPAFKDMFLTSIHNKSSLSKIHKFQYLNGALKDEAASVIKHITISETNYDQAWEKLLLRYNKNKQILTAYVKTFLSQSALTITNSASLRKLTDTSDEIIRGVSSLGEGASLRDPWLIHILLNKCDNETRKCWAEESHDTDFPKFDDFISFLTKRCDALAELDSNSKRFIPNAKPDRNVSIRNHYIKAIVKCPKCEADHHLFNCKQFKDNDTSSRRKLVEQKRLCFNCLSSGHRSNQCKSKNVCHFCARKHHSLLHESLNDSSFRQPQINISQQQGKPVQSNTTIDSQRETHVHSLLSNQLNTNKIALLPTALVYVQDNTGNLQPCRILLDSGSQASFISENFAQKLNLKRRHANILVQGLGFSELRNTKGKLSITLISRFDQYQKIDVTVFVLQKVTSLQPTVYFNIKDWSYLNSMQLADPHFYKPQKIDVLLGIDHFISVLKPEKHLGSKHQPSFQNTIFGFIAAGAFNDSIQETAISSHHVTVQDIDNSLRKFWEVEDILNQASSYTLEEEFCETHFAKTHYVDKKTNRYVVQLPLKEEPLLGNSLQAAMRRFMYLEKRLEKDNNLKEQYCEFMKEYKNMGHLETIPATAIKNNSQHFFLPHHAVLRPNNTTTKLRVVFDGSAATSTGVALNQKLMIGPKIQRDLFEILLSFRIFKIAITSDVEKMYRMVLVDDQHRNFQRILWRDNPDEPMQYLWLNTVTYGTSAAPFLATRALNELTYEFEGQFPLAELTIRNHFYVDDLMSGAHDINQAIELQQQLTTLLKLRGFRLRKWASNNLDFLDTIPFEDRITTNLKINEHSDSIKILGLKWNPVNDYFTFEVNLASTAPSTKRIILSESSRIFDPLGLISPITIRFKMLLQQIWLQNLSWDEEVLGEIKSDWEKMRNSLVQIQEFQIPRWIFTSSIQVELHGFSDSSDKAYAAVIYARVISANGEVKISLLASKTRVAPLKPVTIPRKELLAACLLVKLMKSVKNALQLTDIICFGWTDSVIVLYWLSSCPSRWKCFIANRTSQILEYLPRSQWSYVKSKENPADIASRGASPSQLKECQLWWNGPNWLRDKWQQSSTKIPDPELKKISSEERKCNLSVLQVQLIRNDTLELLFEKKSSLMQIFRIIARCIRLLRNCKRTNTTINTNWLTSEEIRTASQICIKWVQQTTFPNEMHMLKNNKNTFQANSTTINTISTDNMVPASSSLHNLTPFLDADGIIRVGGRLEKSVCSFQAKHPIILPKTHRFVNLLIKYVHETHFHSGTNLTLNILRQSYWIISCRNSVKRHIHHCVTCQRYRIAESKQLMASLPKSRVVFTRPFQNVGIDYAGPIPVLMHRSRGSRTTKGYIALFICMSTKALHLEISSELSTEAFISCLKRFIGRRGYPSTIQSDNGTNFVGAKRKLTEMQQLFMSEFHNTEVANIVSAKSITWIFNPPAAPHFGGIWERAVRSVKLSLKKTIGDSKLTFEELTTLAAEIEGVLNSRPIAPISDDISSLDALTPAHFLIGQPVTNLPEPTLDHEKTTNLNKMRQIQKMKADFWKRWYYDYLPSLQIRNKWTTPTTNLKNGNLVIIKEPNLPPATWALGRIEQTHPGKDNLVRVATIKTSSRLIKRPICKLIKLNIN